MSEHIQLDLFDDLPQQGKPKKKRLHADEYTVTAKRNQLTVKFSVHYDKEEATQGR